MGSSQPRENGSYARLEEHPDAPIDEATHLQMDDYEAGEDSSPPTPRFLQDEGSWRNLTWVPSPIRRVGKAAKKWARGPNPPQIQAIQPWFPSVQELPIRLLDHYLPKRKQRIGLLLGFYFCWILSFSLVLRQSTLTGEVGEYGKPTNIWCGASHWSSGNSCGLNGNDCRPFNGSAFAFRCPANCLDTIVLNPKAVGDQEINYIPLVVGGPSEEGGEAVYRGDSFICSSAIHAGVIDNTAGGCGVVQTTGLHSSFPKSTHNGITSIGFDSYFPLSFSFQKDITCHAKDLRWPLLFISLTFTILMSLFTTSPALFYFTIFVGVFIHTGLVSDPPTHSTMTGLLSTIIGRFLPATFCGFVIFRYMGVRRALTGLTAQVEKTILWLGGLWVGALSNYTFNFIPIQRLNAHDLEQQPGAKLALAIIVVLLACIVVQQIYVFRLEGRLIRYLGIYGILLGSILVSLLLPGLNLRIHHYILALLFLPGTSMQTRPALLYQGLLIGLFINGIARWGFDSVLQTSAELQGDAQHKSLLPKLNNPIIQLGEQVSNITFSWNPPPSPFDGVSVLVNDVERFRGYADEAWDTEYSFFWERKESVGPEYFRFGYMSGSRSWDYTKAGVWDQKGEWTTMKPGPSRRDLDA
jgi:hypothetical protein